MINLATCINSNSTHVLAISGGPDSVYLLHRLIQFRKKITFNLILAHINYHLRGKESNKDEQFVKKLALRYNLTLEVYQAPLLPKTPNLEARAREIRYAWLEKIRKKHKAAFIFTAHNLNDNLETVLLNMTRGASLNGLGGMQPLANHIARPMLTTSRKEITAYLRRNKIVYRIDKSNQNLSFARNRIRHKVIPQLKRINPHLEKTFLNNQNIISQTIEFLTQQSDLWLEKNFHELSFSNIFFLQLDRVIQKHTLLMIYKKLYGNGSKVSSQMIDRSLKIIQKGHTGKKTSFGEKYWLVNKYGKALFEAVGTQLDGRSDMPRLRIKEILKFPKKVKGNIILIDGEKVNQTPQRNLYIRYTLAGDRIQPLGMKGKKKLQDIFTDKKIPREKRSKMEVLVDSDETIIGLPGLGIVSEKYRVTSKTKTILEITVR